MTQLVALIGNPLKRRHSEIMHNAAFRHFSIDAGYELRELQGEAVPAFVGESRRPPWMGFQVTAPFKRMVMEYLDEIEPGARQIGSVNSVLRQPDGTLVGFNTDAPGFQRAAESELNIRFAGIRAAVAGAGGAARAVVHALVAGGAAQVTICDLLPSRASDLADESGDSARAVEVGDAFEGALGRVNLAVNATTVGMIERGVAFDVAKLPDSAVVFDLVYNPPESELLQRARARGLPATNGLGMLVGQAEIAFERWTGLSNAGPVMRKALAAGL
ncbi:MAG: shikimate dehydrogenase [Acidimicrobiia bacterium]|nr:shikimate dehydrogenase [Acidimicrobiia bacterium]